MIHTRTSMPARALQTARKHQRASRATPVLALAAFASLILLEHRRPLRRRMESAWRRAGRNLAVAMAAAVALQILEKPLVTPVAALVERQKWGILKAVSLPRKVETLLAVILMDYTLYWWHVLLHKAPMLWRCHVVHHTDLDLDATTALRFHFAELIASVPWRVLQIAFLGISPRALRIWQVATMMSVAFHHSNLRLPREWDDRLSRIVTTPRLHGIHHSSIREEANTNLSSGLTLWDRLHGTLRRDVAQARITIGVPAYRDPRELTIGRLFLLPFLRQRPTWRRFRADVSEKRFV